MALVIFKKEHFATLSTSGVLLKTSGKARENLASTSQFRGIISYLIEVGQFRTNSQICYRVIFNPGFDKKVRVSVSSLPEPTGNTPTLLGP